MGAAARAAARLATAQGELKSLAGQALLAKAPGTCGLGSWPGRAPSNLPSPSLSPQELEAAESLDGDVGDVTLLTGELLIDLGCASEDESEAEGAGQGQT